METWERDMKRHAEPTATWARRWSIEAGDRRDRTDSRATYTGDSGWVRAGWIPILDRLAEDLIALGWDRVLAQVKEKFGGLRFYIGTGSTPLPAAIRERIERRIAWAMAESLRTCEQCGAPGRPTQPGGEGGIVETLCSSCFDAQDAEVRERRAEEEREQAEWDAEMRAREEELAKNNPEYRAYLEENVWNRDADSLPSPARMEVVETSAGRSTRFAPAAVDDALEPKNDKPSSSGGSSSSGGGSSSSSSRGSFTRPRGPTPLVR